MSLSAALQALGLLDSATATLPPVVGVVSPGSPPVPLLSLENMLEI